MQPWMYFVLFALGLILIIKGSDFFIDSVVWAATAFKIPYIIIGATIVSICTTMPETFVSVTAAFRGETDIAFGNALGSTALNTGLILGILVLFAKPIIEDRKSFAQNGGLLLAILVFGLVVGLTIGEINLFIGLILLAVLAYYLYSNYRQAKHMMRIGGGPAPSEALTDNLAETKTAPSEEEAVVDLSRNNIIKKLVFFAVGITAVIFGSGLLVDNGILIAEFLGVPSIVIAVTFTSLGTSLPELVTTISSIRKKVTNLGVGNIIGANILNLVQVIGLSALVTPIPLDHDQTILTFQFPMAILLVGSAIGFGLFTRNGFRRWQGGVLLLLYAVFLAFNLFRENTPILGDLFF